MKQGKDEFSGKRTTAEKAAEKQAEKWEQRFEESSIKRELLGAAKNDAFGAKRMVNLLKANTKLAASPYIKGIFTNLNSIDLKQAGQNTLYISGSRGNNNLKNIPVSELILDEVDEMDQKQIWLALERLSGQLRKPSAKANPDVRGFYVNQLYSYTVNAGELVTAFLRGQGDEWAATEFSNSKLGLPYVGAGAKVTEEMIDATIGSYSMDDLRPDRSGRLITMGVDQGNTNHVVVCEWTIDGDAHKDLSAAALCKVLYVEKYPSDDGHRLDELMREWQVLFCVVDADPETNEMRRFARRYPGFVALTRYRKGQAGKEISESEEDTGAPMLTIDRSSWL